MLFSLEDETIMSQNFGHQSPSDTAPQPRKNRNMKKLMSFERGAKLGSI
jgi:hypothetical protein